MVINKKPVSYAGSKPSRYLKIIGLCLLFFISQYKAYSLAADTTVINQQFFEQVSHIPQTNRIDLITNLYKNTFRKAAPAIAMANLDHLADLARNQGDQSLECAVFDMKADYYSVNNGFNTLSSSYYLQAVDFAITNNMLFESGLYLHKMGVYQFIFKKNAEACQYFLRSQEKFTQLGFDKVPHIGYYLLNIATFYYRLGDYDNAKTNLETALKYMPANSRDRINIINTVGLIYRNYKQFPMAIAYFNKSLALAMANKDTVWIGIAKGNIGSVYFLQNKYQKALPLIQMDYITSIKHDEPLNAVIALLRLIKINIDYKKFAIAGRQLQSADSLLTSIKLDVLGQRADYYDLKSQLDEQLGKAAESIIYRKKFEQDKDSLAKRNNITTVERVKSRWEIDKHTAQLNKLRADQNIYAIKLYAGIAVLVLLVIISTLVYNHQRLKSKKDKELLTAEKRVVDEGLKSAETALQIFTENLREKNNLIEQFKQEIDRLNRLSTGQENALNLEKLLQAHIMTNESWNSFKKLFSKVHPGFFINLSKKHPQLSSTDTRLLALIKLGLNNSEMANMLGITVEGVKKAKQRLRKKIDIDAFKIIDNDDAA